MDCILVRYGEISLKSDFVRAEFEKLLMKNISEALTRKKMYIEKIVKVGARIFVFCDDLKKAIPVLQNVFGIVSVSPVYLVKNELETFKDWAVKVYELESKNKNKSFRVTVRRQDKSFPLDSTELGKILGEHVFEKTMSTVDLHSPELNINFEITTNGTYVFSRVYRGPGGLPIGSQGRVVCVFKDAKLSILSIFEIMRRGCYVTVLCNEKNYLKKLGNLSEKYYSCGELMRVCIDNVEPEDLAFFEGADAIVLDLWTEQIDNKLINELELNQKKLPVFTPLIGLSKKEIDEKSKILKLSTGKSDKFLEICKNINIGAY